MIFEFVVFKYVLYRVLLLLGIKLLSRLSHRRYLLSWGTAYFSLNTKSDLVCMIYQILSIHSETYSDYALVAMMIERCVVVFFPLHAKTLVTRRFTLILLCLCIIPMWATLDPFIPSSAGVVYGFSAWTLIGTTCVSLCDGPNFFMYALNFNQCVIHVVATLILVVVLGTKLLANRRRRRHLVGGKGDQSAREYSVIVVMLLLAIINIVVFFPGFIVSMLAIFGDLSSWSAEVFNNIARLTNEVTCVAHSIHFLVYFCRIPSFRSELVNLLSCCISK